MRWHPSNRERSFLRFARRLAELIGIPLRELALEFAFYDYRQGRSAWETFQLWARG